MKKTFTTKSETRYLHILHIIDNDDRFNRIFASGNQQHCNFIIEYESNFIIDYDVYNNIIIEEVI